MRRVSWILWLLILLMPARGIAQSMMGVAPTQPGHVAAAEAAPCPMHASGSADDTDSMQAAQGNDTLSHVCSLCNVCHSAMLPLASEVPTASALPESEPIPAHGLGAGRAPSDGLFRPPR